MVSFEMSLVSSVMDGREVSVWDVVLLDGSGES